MVPFEIVYRKPGKPANVLKHKEREYLEYYADYLNEFIKEVEKDEQYN